MDKRDIYSVLDELGIEYERFDHPAVFTVEEAEQYDQAIDAGKCKNLFLRNQKGDKHYLFVTENRKPVDLRRLSSLIGQRLSFASPERLMTHLGLIPGAVSPFGLINDGSHSVIVLIDKDLLVHERLTFHPNVNTATLAIRTEDFRRFLDWTKNRVVYINL